MSKWLEIRMNPIPIGYTNWSVKKSPFQIPAIQLKTGKICRHAPYTKFINPSAGCGVKPWTISSFSRSQNQRPEVEHDIWARRAALHCGDNGDLALGSIYSILYADVNRPRTCILGRIPHTDLYEDVKTNPSVCTTLIVQISILTISNAGSWFL